MLMGGVAFKCWFASHHFIGDVMRGHGVDADWKRRLKKFMGYFFPFFVSNGNKPVFARHIAGGFGIKKEEVHVFTISKLVFLNKVYNPGHQ